MQTLISHSPTDSEDDESDDSDEEEFVSFLDRMRQERKHVLQERTRAKLKRCSKCIQQIFKNLCSEYKLKEYKFFEAVVSMNQWANSIYYHVPNNNKQSNNTETAIYQKEEMKYMNIDDTSNRNISTKSMNINNNNNNNIVETTFKSRKHSSCKSNKCKWIVYGYIRKKQTEYNLNIIPTDIIDLCFMFHHQFVLELQNPAKATPFTLLFATYHLRLGLEIATKHILESELKTQCLYLRDEDINKHFKQQVAAFNVIKDWCISETTTKSNLYDQFIIILSTFYEENELLSKSTNVAEWTQHDLLISFIHHLIHQSNNINATVKTWEFVEYLGRYFQKIKYDGMQFCKDMEVSRVNIIEMILLNQETLYINVNKK